MKLEYNIETLLFHLKHVKRMCMEDPDCTKCTFNISEDRPYIECVLEGLPEDWDLKAINKKEGD